MLQTIRDRAQGWIAWAIVILISIPFALWGIQEYLGGGSQPVIASVNDREITEAELDRRYQEFRSRLRDQLGSAYRPELFDDEKMRKQVLEGMIHRELILQESGRLGLYASDQMVRGVILNDPQFQKDGRFDQDSYERALRYRGLNSRAFEERMRLRLITSQLSRAIEASEFVTQRELIDAVRLRDQKRQFEFLVLPLAGFMEDRAFSEEDIDAYYRAHQGRFRVPERIKVEYLTLDADSIGAKLEPDEETLRGFYEADQDHFYGGEQRRASHILVALAPDADQASIEAAEKKIQDALMRIEEGEEFAAVAREMSDDPGSSEAGGDLGFLEREMMDPAFEDAAFSAEASQVAGPVRSRFGFHLIKVTEIKAAEAPSFDEQRESVLKAYRRSEGERLFYDYAERLSDLSYENPDSLEPAANALGLEIERSDWMDRSGGSSELAHPKAVAAAFSEDVLVRGNNSEAVELGPQQVLVLRILDHKKEHVRPLEDARAEITDLLRKEQAADKAREIGETLLARLRAGETLEKIAAETGHELQRPEAIRRVDTQLPANLVSAVFRSLRPGQHQPTYGAAVLENQDYVLFALSEVTEGSISELDESSHGNEKSALRRSRGRYYFDHLVRHLREEATVELR